MADSDQAARVASIEQTLGCRLPEAYLSFLRGHQADPSAPEQVVSTNPDYWGVRSILEIGSGPDYLQVDGLLKLVWDVLPPCMLPIADDAAGNLYLLDCSPGSTRGQVYWWDHERDLGDHRVELVARSFPAFLDALAPDDE